MTFRSYTELIFFKTWIELKSESAKTYIGVLWWILDPIIYMSVFYFVFVVLLERRTEDIVAFLLVGLTVFRWFASSMNNACNAIMQGKGLMQQVYLPKSVFPVVNLAKNTFKFVIAFGILVAYLNFSGYAVNLAYIALIPLLFLEFLMCLGVSLVVAAIVPIMPDLRIVIGHCTTFLLFMSGTFYSGKDLGPAQQELFYLNPLAYLLEAFREVLLYARWPEFDRLLPAAILAVTSLAIGWALLRKFDKEYPKLVKVR